MDTAQLNSYERLEEAVDGLMCEGFSGHQLVLQLLNNVVENGALTDRQKSEICAELGKAEHALLEGADEYLQMMSIATVMMKVVSQG